jgi:hypothetical protein
LFGAGVGSELNVQAVANAIQIAIEALSQSLILALAVSIRIIL